MEHVIEIEDKAYTQVEKYVIEYNQTWSQGSERDYVGTWNGSLLGNFDKITFSVLPKTKEENQQLIKDLRKGLIKVKYFDFEKLGFVEAKFIRANLKVTAPYISENEIILEPIEISFMPERRR